MRDTGLGIRIYGSGDRVYGSGEVWDEGFMVQGVLDETSPGSWEVWDEIYGSGEVCDEGLDRTGGRLADARISVRKSSTFVSWKPPAALKGLGVEEFGFEELGVRGSKMSTGSCSTGSCSRKYATSSRRISFGSITPKRGRWRRWVYFREPAKLR